MKIDYWKVIEKFNDELDKVDNKITKLIDNVRKEDEWLFDHCVEIFDVEDVLAKVPVELRTLEPAEVMEFAFYLKRVFNVPSTQLKPSTRALINIPDPKKLAILLNEIVFFASLCELLPETDKDIFAPDWLVNIPKSLRLTKEVKKAVKDALEESGAPINRVDDEIEAHEGFFYFLHDVLGLELRPVKELIKKTNQIMILSTDTICDFDFKVHGRSMNVSCSDEYFFISYFTLVFKSVYECNAIEASFLMASLYESIFDSFLPRDANHKLSPKVKKSLLASDDLEDLIKKRLSRETKRWKKDEFTGKIPSKKSVDSKIKKLAEYRVGLLRKAL